MSSWWNQLTETLCRDCNQSLPDCGQCDKLIELDAIIGSVAVDVLIDETSKTLDILDELTPERHGCLCGYGEWCENCSPSSSKNQIRNKMEIVRERIKEATGMSREPDIKKPDIYDIYHLRR